MVYNEKRKIYTTIIAFTAVIIIAMLAISQPGKGDPHTTLYFTNPAKPLIYNAAENTITIDFTVENHELQDLNYSYIIALEYHRNQTLVSKETKEGVFTLKNNERVNISEILTTQGQRDRLKISLHLYKEGVNETYRSLRYWMDIS